jgi:hypothetical protein
MDAYDDLLASPLALDWHDAASVGDDTNTEGVVGTLAFAAPQLLQVLAPVPPTPPAISSFPRLVAPVSAAARFTQYTESFFVLQPPSIVYQQGGQHGGKLHVILQLSALAAAALNAMTNPVSNALQPALRRFDQRRLMTYDERAQRMVPVTLPPLTTSEAVLSANGILHVYINRKLLPVSTAFGEAPFVYTVFIRPVGEVVVSASFFARSKAPKDTGVQHKVWLAMCMHCKTPVFTFACLRAETDVGNEKAGCTHGACIV